MDDLDLDRELRQALQVTPSPEFVARVRTKIAEGPRPTIFAGVLKPAAAIACLGVLAITVAVWHQEARLKPSPTKTAHTKTVHTESAHTESAPKETMAASEVPELKAEQTFIPSRALRYGGLAEASARVGMSAELGRSAPAPVEPPVPEVIIPPGDIQALQQFMASATELRFVASFEETPVPTSWVVTELTIPPLTITPLDPEPSKNN